MNDNAKLIERLKVESALWMRSGTHAGDNLAALLNETIAALSPPPQSGDVADEAKLEELLSDLMIEVIDYANASEPEYDKAVEPKKQALRSFFKRAAKGGEGMVSLVPDPEMLVAIEQGMLMLRHVADGARPELEVSLLRHANKLEALQSALATKHS